MADGLNKQTVSINFASGLDTKTDEWQLPPGKFAKLTNAVFTAQGGSGGGRLNKRNGFGSLPALPNDSFLYVTTLSGALTAFGTAAASLSQGANLWSQVGSYTPLNLSTLSTVRANQNVVAVDSATAQGLLCTAWTEQSGSAASGVVTTKWLYQVQDATTGSIIVQPTTIPPVAGVISGTSRVFATSSYFLVVTPYLTSGSTYLQYIALPLVSVTGTPLGPKQLVNEVYVPLAETSGWDGVVQDSGLIVAYNTIAGVQGIHVASITQQQIAGSHTTSTVTAYAGSDNVAAVMGACSDVSTSPPTTYVAFSDSASGNAYVLALQVNANAGLFVPIIDPFLLITSVPFISNITCAAQNGTCTVFAEGSASQIYDSTIPANIIVFNTVSPLVGRFIGSFSNSGTVITTTADVVNGLAAANAVGATLLDLTNPSYLQIGSAADISALGTNTITIPGPTAGAATNDTLIAIKTGAPISGGLIAVRSLGLASKAFIVDGTIYVVGAYQSPFQSSYFVVRGDSLASSPRIVAKLAYENGGGYLPYALPAATVSGAEVTFSYLYKDLVQALATQNNSQQTTTGGVYSQLGTDCATLDFAGNINSTELAGALHASGGFLWEYDGQNLVEHNFFLWPEQIEATYTEVSTVTPTGTALNGSTAITLSSGSGVHPGMTITDTAGGHSAYIPAGTTIVSISGTSAVMSAATTHAISGDSLSIHGNIWDQPDGSTNADAYYYQALYAWTDAAGQTHRSAPSIPISMSTTPAGTDKTGLATINVPTYRPTMKISTPVRIEIYRWSVAESSYFEVTSPSAPLLNDPAADYVTFTDTYSDSQIVGNQLIYTTGGVLEDINGPACNGIMTAFDTRLWMLDAEDPNLWWFSKPLVEGTPVEMSDLLTYYVEPSVSAQGNTGPTKAAAPMDDKLVMFKQAAMYYVNGTGPDSTGANSQYSQPIFIVSPVGCTDQASIVMTPAGLMFQASDGSGIWLLNRSSLQVEYVGAPVEAFNNEAATSSACPPGTTQVRTALSSGQQLMYDYYYGQWGSFEGASAISSCVYQGLHTILTSQGTVLQETPGQYADGANPVRMSFTTGWISMAGLQGYERLYEIALLANYQSPHGLLVSLAYDFGPISESKIIRPSNRTQTYGQATPYGNQTPFGGPETLEQWKISVRRQTCQAFQVTVQEIPDPYVQVAGAGLTISGLALTVGLKKGRRPIGPVQSR